MDICHYKPKKDVYKKRSVGPRAAIRHLKRHEDLLPGTTNTNGTIRVDNDCNVVNQPTVLAIAYIDKNRNGVYDADADVMISQLLDSDGEPSLTVGDTIELGKYPTTVDPCPDPTGPCTAIADFSPFETLTVTYVQDINQRPEVRVVSIDDPNTPEGIDHTYRWTSTPAVVDSFFVENNIVMLGIVFIRDQFAPGNTIDQIVTNNAATPLTIGHPNPDLNIELIALPGDEVDSYFINVEIP